ncbi:MAG: precorrin-2 C(20)-methyltransferase, partial [Desulfovibrio sp.]|nr:precorrin-2 C(20)-methyltransferase [Desulfovibrio sp.]
PMTRNRDVLEEAWGLAAEKTLAVLESGRNAAFLTLGDPLVYSTFAYLHRHLKRIAPDAQVEIVPGITSFQAACARAGHSLCEGEDNVRIVSGINDAAVLEREIADADTAVILKAYRNFPAIAGALEKLGRARTSLCVSHVEQEKEEIRLGVDAGRRPPYMTLIISKK